MTAQADEDPVRAWQSLPRRIYLDTSVLQKLFDFGGEIFEGEPFQPVGRASRVQGLAEEVEALRMIFLVNERTMFDFVVTEATLLARPCREERVVVDLTHVPRVGCSPGCVGAY